MLFSMAVTDSMRTGNGRGSRLKLDFTDVRRAYFHAKTRRPLYIQLPEEDAEEGVCGICDKSIYGSRDAAQNWEEEYRDFLVNTAGFERGRASPCVFYNRKRNLRIVVHGDDFTVLGADADLDWFRTMISNRYEVKFRARLGPDDNDDKAVRILNRLVAWTNRGIVYEADQRHAEIIISMLGLNGKKTAVSPGIKPADSKEEIGDDELLEPEAASEYRRLTARANYLAQDRLDIRYTVKELTRWMSKPRNRDKKRLIRLAKYLIGKERYVMRFDYQKGYNGINVWTDTDYAGCRETRKSTSGGLVLLGSHLIKGWSSTQKVIALSSGEAEYYGLVKGASEGMGTRSIMEDLGSTVQVKIHEDSTPAKGIANRTGLGKVRHIEVSQLWVQEKVRDREVVINKVKGTDNLADALTKYVGPEELRVHMVGTNSHVWTGRHQLMPVVDERVFATCSDNQEQGEDFSTVAE